MNVGSMLSSVVIQWRPAPHLLYALEGLVASVAVVQDVQQLVHHSDLRLENLALDQLEHIVLFNQHGSDSCIYATATNSTRQQRPSMANAHPRSPHVGFKWQDL